MASAFEDSENNHQSSAKAESGENVEKRFDKLKDTDKVLPEFYRGVEYEKCQNIGFSFELSYRFIS
ncbi:hypothetical protein RyT2_04400 [Pseudolactococcus yaeyamensis]